MMERTDTVISTAKFQSEVLDLGPEADEFLLSCAVVKVNEDEWHYEDGGVWRLYVNRT